MGSLKALLIAGMVVSATSLSARAADLLPPPPPLEAPADAGPDFGNWYLRADVGVGNAIGSNLKSSFSGSVPEGATLGYEKSSIDDSALVGLGVGYQAYSWLRFDVTGEYRTAQHTTAIESYSYGGYRAFDKYDGSIQSSVMLANGYFDLGTWHCLTPYLGAGVGFAYNRVYGLSDFGVGSTFPGGAGNGGFGWAPDKNTFTFAWAAMAGFSYDITRSLKVDVSYRYLDMGRVKSGGIDCIGGCGGLGKESKNYDLASNDIRVGLRWMFNTPAAPVYEAPQMPIVRKY